MRTRPRSRHPPPGMFEQIFGMMANMARGSDLDRDGVPDFKDCSPFNPKFHGIWPSRRSRERLEQLPIMIAHQRVYYGGVMPGEAEKPYHIMQKEARKRYPKETRAALSAIKKQPTIIGKMEKLRAMGITPYLYFLGKPDPWAKEFARSEITGTVSDPHREVYVNLPPQHEDMIKSEYLALGIEGILEKVPPHLQDLAFARLKAQADRLIFKDTPAAQIPKKVRDSYIESTLHELKHIEQSKDPEAFNIRVEQESTRSWLERETEQEAIKYAREQIERRIERGELDPKILSIALKRLLEE